MLGEVYTSWVGVLTFWGKEITFSWKVIFLGVFYIFRLASKHYVKSTKKKLALVHPPPFGNAKILRAPVIQTPPLLWKFTIYQVIMWGL